LGFVGGTLVGLPSYVFAGDIGSLISFFDIEVVIGVLIRMAIFGGLGAGYGYLVPLPADRWSAFERGVMAPGIIGAMIFLNTPSGKDLDTSLNAQAFNFPLVGSAYAQQQPAVPPRKPSTIRQIIRGILGK
jgi:hypothetical protein